MSPEERERLLESVDISVTGLPADPLEAAILGFRRGIERMKAGHDYHVGVHDGVHEAFEILGEAEDERAMLCRRKLMTEHPPSAGAPWSPVMAPTAEGAGDGGHS